MKTKTQPEVSIPQPFLGPLFEPEVEPVIATGFHYTPEEIAIHGVPAHNAIDLDLPRGTKILAPADGYYLCTYGEFLTIQDDQPRTLSLEQARRGNPRNLDIRPPNQTGEWEVYFGSYVVQGWHGNGRYTQYAHLDWAEPRIPYHPPREVVDDDGNKTADLAHSLTLRAPVSEYRKSEIAAFVRAGEVIAQVGMTGCGWGRRCYEFAEFDVQGRPDFRAADYFYYAQPHLHFATFGRRAPRSRNAKLIDPFGVYGEVDAGYPQSRAQWHEKMPAAKHAPLWLHQNI